MVEDLKTVALSVVLCASPNGFCCSCVTCHHSIHMASSENRFSHCVHHISYHREINLFSTLLSFVLPAIAEFGFFSRNTYNW